ncbi:MAG TPA: hypothetical protein VFV09_14730, partial [Actinomycetota bacterium]|nr:hypothetical protein [Actinomycetota bacterium]
MWPFKKRVAGTQGPDSPLEKVGRSPSGEWAGVPAIERTVTPLPTTIETTSFQADLAAQRPPAQFLKPLSHGLSPSGPSGLIGGLVMPARPTERAVRVQRSAVKFAPRPGGRWVTDLPAEVEQAGASDQTRLADPGPATAYPAAPEPPVQADPLPAPAPDAPKPAGGRPVLLRVDSDALPIVRLPSSPRPASPPVEAPVAPAPAGFEPARPQAPQAPAPEAGDLGTLGGEPEASQPAASTEAHPPSPLSSSGEP